MPANRNALIRYKTIDRCLQNRFRKWTLDDLIAACSDALYEYEGMDKGVSKRTVQLDIQTMRSSKLGYNAPIVVQEKKYYAYADKDYSITNIPLTDQDLTLLNEVVATLEQFSGFTHFMEFGVIVKRLEDQLSMRQQARKAIIDFERNEDLKGRSFIDPCYKAISAQHMVKLTYQSFRARQPSTFAFHPQFLKEYNNRWFVIGIKAHESTILTLALDRISEIIPLPEKAYIDLNLDPTEYYKDVIGVTVNKSRRPMQVIFKVDWKNAPYIRTKPFHSSQVELDKDEDGVRFRIRVQHNYELERLILGFGSSIVVEHPKKLRDRISQIIRKAGAKYPVDFEA